MSSSSTESLSVLAKYSQNLPSLARSLSRTQVNNEMRKEIKEVGWTVDTVQKSEVVTPRDFLTLQTIYVVL